ncbi:SRPBCC family protein [Alicyclobacillus fastidiosus]|uniref:SRPBCC family protein n=1 Tax=Alicyclobacillus fastidiosus TaxID=392011 RepID=A0ABV5AI57_9BACL|nr:SRPBCC family protein [Alicyclobacillus fastidiosus]WEH10125.1 SRPBCC family protein [Alicyclobacillus fastidiosus]
MNNCTKITIRRPVTEVFEAFVDPLKIGNFWFSSSSERWEQGKAITLTYDEYDAQVDIQVLGIKANQEICFQWGTAGEGHVVTISLKDLDGSSTLVEVNEEGFHEDDENLIVNLVDNKEGWVYMLTCLKAYVEFGVNQLRAGLVKG